MSPSIEVCLLLSSISFNFTDVQSIYRPVTINYGDKAFWTGDVHKTVLNIPAYNMHPG